MTDVTSITTDDVLGLMSASAQEALNTAETMENNCGAITAILMHLVPQTMGGRAVEEKAAHRLAHMVIDVVRTYGENLQEAVEAAKRGELNAKVEVVRIEGDDGDGMTKH